MSCFDQTVKSSKVCNGIKRAFHLLKDSFLGSKLYAVLLRLVNLFADAYTVSRLRKTLVGTGDIERFADSSLFYRVFSGFTDRLVHLVKKIVAVFEPAADSSFILKLYHHVFKQDFRVNALGFVAFVCTFIFVIPHSFWSNTFGMLFAGVLFVLYAVAVGGTDKSLVPGQNGKAIWFSTIVFGFSLVLNCFVSYDRGDSLRVLLFFITSFMLMLVLYAFIRDEKGLDTVAGFMYGALMFTSVVAIAQRLVGVEADGALTDLELNANMPGRVFSTLANPNNFAEFLVLFMPFGLAFALSKPKEDSHRLPLLCGMLLPLAAILLTFSRSGWIALAIAGAIFMAIYERRLIPVFIIVCVLAVPFLPESVTNRILTIGNLEDSSSSYRVDIWTGCIKMLKDYWFTGVGLGTGGFAEIYPQYAIGESSVAPHSHMHFMEMLVELGVIGFVSYVCMTFTLIRRSFLAAAKAVPTHIRVYGIAAAASMSGIVMIGLFEYCWFYPRVMFAFFMAAGIAMATYRLAKNAPKDGTACQ